MMKKKVIRKTVEKALEKFFSRLEKKSGKPEKHETQEFQHSRASKGDTDKD
jgi:hypothetical protein